MRVPHANLPGVFLAALMTMGPALVAADEPVESELRAIRDELQALRREVAEQGEMIRTLYDFADSQIDFERKKKERQEEERLLLEPAVDIQDANLTSLGCCSPSLPEIAVITGDGGIRIYDMAGQIVRHLKRPGDVITAVAYSPDGKLLLVGTKAGAVAAWNFAAGQWVVVADRVADTVGRVAWLDGTRKAVWAAYVDYHGKDGVKLNRDKPSGGVLDLATGKTDWTFMSFIRDDFQTLSASPDGKKLAVLEIPDRPRGAYVLDVPTGRVQASLFHAEHACGPLSVCIGPAGEIVAVGYAPRDVILWNVGDERLLKTLEGHTNWVVSLAFSPDVRFLISGAGDSTARIWSCESGKELGRIRFSGSSTYVESVGFFPNGEMAFALAKGRLILVPSPRKHAGPEDQQEIVP